MSKRALSNKHFAALALFQLGGAERAVDTEDLAMKVAELAPGRFRWKKYPEQIDLEAVRLSVKNLLRDVPPFVTGSMRHGWMLTPNGVAWCAQVAGQRRGEEAERWAEAVAALRQTEACGKFERGEAAAITVHDVRRFLRVDEYTSTRRRKERVQAVLNVTSGHPQLAALVTFLQGTFSEEWA